MATPFDDQVFVNRMEEILKTYGNDKDRVMVQMNLVDKNSEEYYSYECALCYLLYKAIKLMNAEGMGNEDAILELARNININIEKMKVVGNVKI